MLLLAGLLGVIGVAMAAYALLRLRGFAPEKLPSVDLPSAASARFGAVATIGTRPADLSTVLGDWIAAGSGTDILDMQPGTDRLILVWDDSARSALPPEVRVASNPYDPDVMHVLMNGKVLAEVYGAPDLRRDDLTLMPLSSALCFGLAPG